MDHYGSLWLIPLFSITGNYYIITRQFGANYQNKTKNKMATSTTTWELEQIEYLNLEDIDFDEDIPS